MKKYIVKDGAAVLSAPAFLGASRDELRVLTALALSSSPLSAEELTALLSAEAEDVRDALAFWRGADAVVLAEAQAGEKAVPKKRRYVASADRLSPYDESEAAKIIEDGSLASFIEQCQEIYGRVLSPSDIEIILGLHEQLSFEPEYICLLIAFCVESGKKPMRYIERVACTLYDQQVLTVAELEVYIEKKHRQSTREGKLRRIFGIGDRALSAKEDAAFFRWCEEYGYDDAVITRAFDCALAVKLNPSVAYVDGIIKKWYEAGCKNLQAVEEFIEKKNADRRAAKKPGGANREEKDSMRSFETDDFFEHALARSYGDKKGKKDGDKP